MAHDMQLRLFPEMEVVDGSKSSTFEDNMKIPVHRWYRYTAGFSASWVGDLIEQEKEQGRCHVIDPFVGSGTVALESVFHDVSAIGIESNPYVYNIARAKLDWRKLDSSKLRSAAMEVLSRAQESKINSLEFPDLIMRCYPEDTLRKLQSLRLAWATTADETHKNLIWFIITSILRPCSPVGTAQWQYIQPRKSKANVKDPFVAYRDKVNEIIADIAFVRKKDSRQTAKIILADARETSEIPDGWGDLVITSPPYANNYDYADAMRLEMLFWGDVDKWNKQQSQVVNNLVRACTQHVGKLKSEVNELINSSLLAPIHDELVEVYSRLEKERETHGGKKNYHYMITAYFYDLARVFRTLNKATGANCKMCFVIGDSAPYGVYVPVDEWLGRLALDAGFRNYSFEKLRDRNTKWKNRKHRVPLKEGRLWITK